MSAAPALLFCDIESTGLRPDEPILEVGLRTTDANLNTLAEASWVMPYSGADLTGLRDRAVPFVQEMHDASGLWKECESVGWATCFNRRVRIRAEIVQWIRDNAPGRLPLAGSSVRQDRIWLTHLAPELDTESLIHYRIVDVSSVRILAHLWHPRLLDAEPTGQGKHRVMPDLDDSIELLRYYRAHLFVAEDPGPGADGDAIPATMPLGGAA